MKQRILAHVGQLGRSRTARAALAMVAACALGSGCRCLESKAGKESQAAMSLNLAHAGVTSSVILVPADAKPYEMTAAEELRAYLGKITGAQFPVCREGSLPPAGPVLSVGRTQRLAEAFPALALATLRPDSIVLKTKGSDLFLAGEGTRGTLYAVTTFLEDQCGVRWWTPFEETVPNSPTLAVAPPDRVFEPPLPIARRTASSSLTPS